MAQLVERLQSLRGFVGFLLAAVLGALAVLGHAPFHIWPAFCASILGLFVLLDGAAARPRPIWAGFKVAWSWAFGYFLAGLFWVGNAFLVDAEKENGFIRLGRDDNTFSIFAQTYRARMEAKVEQCMQSSLIDGLKRRHRSFLI